MRLLTGTIHVLIASALEVVDTMLWPDYPCSLHWSFLALAFSAVAHLSLICDSCCSVG